MNHWSGLDEIAGGGWQRGKADEVQRAVRDDEHVRGGRQIRKEADPTRGTATLLRLV